ncbi:MAG TPA: phosphatase PAP2 family protein [Flavisolibacter sp.]|nr:phosphatase PAP2 family protein [Flavisolibacter sp.]
MKKSFALLYALSFACSFLKAQEDTLIRPADTPVHTNGRIELQPVTNRSDQEVYNVKAAVDVPLTVIGVAWSLYGFSKIYNKDTSTTEQILALSRYDVNKFNRSAIDQYSQKAFHTSDKFFYGAMPLPLVLMLDHKMRQDAFKVLFLYLQAMGITGILYTSAAYVHDKYRPYAYNPAAGDRRKRGGAKNSFYAGHVALVATSTFYVAKTYADYHPQSKIKWLFYTLASAATATTGYLRYKAGEHFPTDIILGTGLGTLTGILVPHFHKNKRVEDPALSIGPLLGASNGVSVVYRF